MSLPWKGLPLPNVRGSNRRRMDSKDTWLLRGCALTVFFNIILLYKWYYYHPQTPTPLDDFQML